MNTLRPWLIAAGAIALLPWRAPYAASPPTATATAATAASVGAADPAPTAATPAPLRAERVIEVLDQTIDWYRTLAIQQKAATEPSDLLIVYGNRQTANQVVALAFDAARAEAERLGQTTQDPTPTPSTSLSPAGVVQLLRKLDAQAADVQSEMADTRRSLAAGPRASRDVTRAKLAELQGELDLIAAKKSALGGLADFLHGPGAQGGSSLKAQIDAMAVALSASGVAVGGTSPGAAGAAAAASPWQPTPATPAAALGIWGLGENVLKLSEKLSAIAAIDRRTAALAVALEGLRQPLVVRARALSTRGDQLAALADSADVAGLGDVHAQLDALAADIKGTAAILVPLSKESFLLAQYRRNLADWRRLVDVQSHEALRALAARVGVLAVALAAAFALAELWRRAVLRYAQDSRRRHQLLLLRRFGLWAAVSIIVGVAFANELGSIATFAGLITAGLAVAMQSVLVSLVGYFFLIGKYGIRVGDRVQVGEVTGEVIEVGLVRLYLMEIGGHGSQGATGRVVAFPNSIVFSATGGLFKQMPGVGIAWHELALSVPADVDHEALKGRMLHAAESALADYRGELKRQALEIQRTTTSSRATPFEPQVRLHFSSTGIEATVRYPVCLDSAAEMDERVSRQVLQALGDSA